MTSLYLIGKRLLQVTAPGLTARVRVFSGMVESF
jgi:hypothetical protein